MVTAEQGALFATPAEEHAREWAELVEAWWTAHEWAGRYRCPVCGRLERTRFAFGLNHDQQPGSLLTARSARPGRFCTSRHLSTRQALWGLRQDDPWIWQAASMDLRKMAAALRGYRAATEAPPF
jgi:hypothetical protein